MPNFKEGDLVRFISREARLKSDRAIGRAHYYIGGSKAYFRDLPVETIYRVYYSSIMCIDGEYCRLIPQYCKKLDTEVGNLVLKESLTLVSRTPIL